MRLGLAKGKVTYEKSFALTVKNHTDHQSYCELRLELYTSSVSNI